MQRIGRDLALTIHAIELHDEATYQCSVSQFGRNAVSAPAFGNAVRVVVHVEPTISTPPQQSLEYVTLGSPFKTECEASGVPPPDISWTKNGRIVSQNATLSFDKIDSADQGEYICLAVNSEGKTESSLSLHFSKSAEIDFPLSNKTSIEGSNVQFYCHASAQPSTVVYLWQYEGNPVKTTEIGLRSKIQEGNFVLNRIRRTDQGWYTCEASNGFGPASSSMAYLDVHYRPEVKASNRQLYTFAIGSSGTIDCDVNANPPVTVINWSKNGHVLTPSPGTQLKIANASLEDSGMYSCQAYNSIGSSPFFEIHVVVAAPPSFSKPFPPLVFVKQGNPLLVECHGFGDPPPTVYWVRNYHRINSANLEITQVSHNDHGEYECVLSNSVATVKRKLQLYVQHTRPQPITELKVVCEDERDLRVSFSPGYDGGFHQRFRLHYQDGPTGVWQSTKLSNDTFTFLRRLKPFTKYGIFVESKNEFGSTNGSIAYHSVCATLPIPSSIRLNSMKKLKWEKIKEAKSYKVSMRMPNSKVFRDFVEVTEPEYQLDMTMFRGKGEIEFRVRSLMPPFGESESSPPIALRSNEQGSSALLLYIVGGGLVFLLAFLLIAYYVKKFSKSKDVENQNYSHYVCGNYAPDYPRKPKALLMSENGRNKKDSWMWTSSEEDGSEETDKMDLDYIPETMVERPMTHETVVGDMLKAKYIYGNNGTNLDLVDQLRIERLKKEFGQSQL
ncbi:hypothetical protein QR680_002087 [Steinernema hermaphroditum]|uniref:Uncharacterized protein n=1 Tax=Steinernema hermaphroditum TaxID=289476 RepID=A0AA39LHJ4_9BILA|nr:hypothetical protein QR680_002087 [Steinernema hermaphroditum]